jgi:hypothetical protein
MVSVERYGGQKARPSRAMPTHKGLAPPPLLAASIGEVAHVAAPMARQVIAYNMMFEA